MREAVRYVSTVVFLRILKRKIIFRKINDILGGALDNEFYNGRRRRADTGIRHITGCKKKCITSAPVTTAVYGGCDRFLWYRLGYQTAAQAYEAAYNSVISVISGQDYSGITQI